MAMHSTMPLRWIEEAEARKMRDWARLARQEAGRHGEAAPRSVVSLALARLWAHHEGRGECRRQTIRCAREIAYESDPPDRHSLGGPDGWSDAR